MSNILWSRSYSQYFEYIISGSSAVLRAWKFSFGKDTKLQHTNIDILSAWNIHMGSQSSMVVIVLEAPETNQIKIIILIITTWAKVRYIAFVITVDEHWMNISISVTSSFYLVTFGFSDCHSCYHKSCFIPEKCPKCARIEARWV